MSETENQEQAPIILDLRKIYVDDLSIEVPNAPQIFQENISPEILLNIAHEIIKLPEEDFYAVRLKLTVKAQENEEKTVYLVSISQCGVFQLSGLSDAQLHHALNVYCPTTLFPYARESISNSVVKAGFPIFFLQPINFEQIYQERLQEFLKEQENKDKNGE